MLAEAILLEMPPRPCPEPDERRQLDLIRGRFGRHIADQHRAVHAGRVEAVAVGQQHQPPGAQQDRDLGRQHVVVAERDVVGRRRVVLVDDRDGPELDQPKQRVPRVDVGRATLEVAARSAAPGRARRRGCGTPAGTARTAPPAPPPMRPAGRAARSGARRCRGAASPQAIAALVTSTGWWPWRWIRTRSRTRASSTSSRKRPGGVHQRGRPDLDDEDGHSESVPLPAGSIRSRTQRVDAGARREVDRRIHPCRRRVGIGVGGDHNLS